MLKCGCRGNRERAVQYDSNQSPSCRFDKHIAAYEPRVARAAAQRVLLKKLLGGRGLVLESLSESPEKTETMVLFWFDAV